MTAKTNRYRCLALLVALLYVCAVVALPQLAAAQSELLTNGGFDTGNLTGWTDVTAAGSVTVVQDTVHAGSHALSLGGSGGKVVRQGFTAAASGYTLSAWIMDKADNLSRHGDPWIDVVLNGNLAAPAATCAPTADDIWWQCSLTFTASAGDTVWIDLHGRINSRFDTVSVSQVVIPPTAVPPTATPIPPTPTPTPPPSDAGKPCYVAAQFAVDLIGEGVDYCWGSRDPDVPRTDTLCPTGYGLDCSGLVIWAYREAGVDFPNADAKTIYARYQHVSGSLSGAGLKIGDVVVLGKTGPADVYHIAMYVGGGVFADCFNTGVGCVTHEISNVGAYVNAGFVGYARPSVNLGLDQCVTDSYVVGAPPTGSDIGPGGPSGGGWMDAFIPGWREMMDVPDAQPVGYTQEQADTSLLPAELAAADDGWTASFRGSTYNFGAPIDVDAWGIKAKVEVRYRYISEIRIMGIDIILEPVIYTFLVFMLIYIVRKR